MNTQQLEYFVVLAELLSYTKAAEELGIAQPTLTKAIRHLESECGFPLIQKKGRNIVLTRQAEQFLPYVTQSLNELYNGLKSVSCNRKNLRIGAVTAMNDHIPEIISAVHSVSPNTFITLKTGVSSELIASLRKHELDFTDRFSPQTRT